MGHAQRLSLTESWSRENTRNGLGVARRRGRRDTPSDQRRLLSCLALIGSDAERMRAETREIGPVAPSSVHGAQCASGIEIISIDLNEVIRNSYWNCVTSIWILSD